MKTTGTNYSISGESLEGWRLAVFYDGHTTIDGAGCSLNWFMSCEKYQVKRVDFVQGNDRKHDSHHVWYVDVSN